MRANLLTSNRATCLLAILLVSGLNVFAQAAAPVAIQLRPEVAATSAVVRIADIAEVSGGDVALRSQIAELDLEEAPPVGEPIEVTRTQIEFRLRLAGIDPRQVAIRGASSQVSSGAKSKTQITSAPKLRSVTNVEADVSDHEQAVLRAAQTCLSKKLPWDADSLVVRLAHPLSKELREQLQSGGGVCSVELRSTGTPVGQVAARVIVQTPQQRLLESPLLLDVRHFEEVVVTSKPVARGHVFAEDDFERTRQDVTLLTGYSTSPESFIGQKAKRILPASQIVRASDLEPATRVPEPLLVKRRDRVKAIVRSGALQVSMVAEAQQDGRVGDVIKVKNVVSNTIVHGRVLNANEVEVTE